MTRMWCHVAGVLALLCSKSRFTGSVIMVFLTLSRWIRNRGPDRYWKVQELLKSARHFRGRKNRCYSLAVRAVRRAFVYASKARKAKRHSMRQLWIQRIAAASREQHMKYPALIHNLLKCSVQLNRRALCDLCISEPRSFKALAALACARRTEGLRAALGDGSLPPGVFSRITQPITAQHG
uniref:Large ribosomal subunit protein bL20m n=2 Tax=Sinocyclocheilus anshuiensis TaxID=1608454 RepID=A0A671QN28_9TELE